MKATNLWIRTSPFLLALLLGLVSSNANPVSSQTREQGGLVAVPIPDSAVSGVPLGVTGAGHVDDQAAFRCPSLASGWPCIIPLPDKIAFTQDNSLGLAIRVSGAAVHDRWTWRFYYPGNPPEGEPDMTCWMEIRFAGEPGNPTDYVALVTNCTPYGQLTLLEYFPSGCPCSFGWGAGHFIAGWPAQSEVGTWTIVVDYTDPEGIPTPAVAQDNMYLMETPAVVLIHGYDASCGSLATLEQHLEEELAVTSDRVKCFDYDYGKGVAAPVGQEVPGDLDRFLAGFRQELGMGPLDEVDLVGHSMGGLVARYYAKRDWCSTAIGSVSMLGTPNEGVWLAKLEKVACPIAAIPAALVGGYFGGVPGLILGEWASTKTCKAVENLVGGLVGFDPDSQGIHDMEPGSQVLDELNDGFVLPEPPELPQYRAHAGAHSSPFPVSLFINPFWRLNEDNDCVVTVKSVRGPNDIFDSGQPFYLYETLTHGGDASAPGCVPPTLTSDASVAQDLVVTIKGNPAGGPLAPEQPAQGEPTGPGLDAPLLMALVDYVDPSQVNTQQVTVPAGLADTVFAVYWPDVGDEEANLSLTLRRPNGQVVDPGDPDVLADLTGAEGGFLDILVGGFVMSAPEAGDWELAVEGVSVPPEGLGYLIGVMPDSQVVLTTATAESDLAQGQPEVITATLFDGSTAIAPTSISALVGTPGGTYEDVLLLDDGVGADEQQGDLTYSGTFTSTAECGRYGVVAIASGDSSEGAVTRGQIDVFQVQVPGDAVRQPCNPDDDEDGLTDADELNITGTDPLDEDTDDDGMPDGYEDARTCLDPLVDDAAADPDSDGLDNLTEYNQGTDPCAAFPPVGGIAQLPDVSDSSPPNYIALAGLAAAALVAFAVGKWCARRRSVR